MIVTKKVHARAGLVGNPSDGYHGKTMAFTMEEFWAEVTLYESPEIEYRPAPQDNARFDSLNDLVKSVTRTGYYGGIRLLKAASKKFAEYCAEKGVQLDNRNFTMRYRTTIPRQVGLGGSSAIITAAMKALMGFYGVDIQDYILPNVVLAAETEELGLTAGLQDRVAQAYNGLVYMDFDKDYMQRHGYGRYERIAPSLLPPLYVACRTDLSQESSDAHIRVREKYDSGDQKVVRTMQEIAEQSDRAKEVLKNGEPAKLGEILNRNFDLRAEIYPISDENMKMVERARSAGASCKFCGSGGAVVGTYDGEDSVDNIREVMEEGGYQFIVPTVTSPEDVL